MRFKNAKENDDRSGKEDTTVGGEQGAAKYTVAALAKGKWPRNSTPLYGPLSMLKKKVKPADESRIINIFNRLPGPHLRTEALLVD